MHSARDSQNSEKGKTQWQKGFIALETLNPLLIQDTVVEVFGARSLRMPSAKSQVFCIKHKYLCLMRTIILDDPVPPVREVAQYGATAVAIYCLMYESAFMDKRFDKNKHLPWEQRRDCGGLCRWSQKAIAETLGIGKKTLINKIDQLLDAGYLQVAGFEMGSCISYQMIYRVTHPNFLDARKWVIKMLPEKPSVAAKKIAQYPRDGGSKFIDESEASELNID